jgi:hypothetical protein
MLNFFKMVCCGVKIFEASTFERTWGTKFHDGGYIDFTHVGDVDYIIKDRGGIF